MLLKIALCNRHLMDLQVFTGGQTQLLLIPQYSQNLMPLLTPVKRLWWTGKGTVLGHRYLNFIPLFFWEHKGATLWLAERSEENCLIAKAIMLNTNHDMRVKEQEKGASSCPKKKNLCEILKCTLACIYAVFCTVTIKMTCFIPFKHKQPVLTL